MEYPFTGNVHPNTQAALASAGASIKRGKQNHLLILPGADVICIEHSGLDWSVLSYKTVRFYAYNGDLSPVPGEAS